MLKVDFLQNSSVYQDAIDFVVIVARYEDKWIVVRYRDRDTWEIPGGHKEKNESLMDAGFRELYEETGAEEFELVPVCIYSVSCGEKTTYGQLFYAEVKKIGDLPEFEIEEIKFVEELPERLTYHSIQPYLFKRVQEFLDYIG